MHLGIFAKTFPRPTFEETLDAIADRGITHVQFNMSCAGLPTLPERPEEDLCVWIARSFRERGLTMAAISGTFNLCDPDESRLAGEPQAARRAGLGLSMARHADHHALHGHARPRRHVEMASRERAPLRLGSPGAIDARPRPRSPIATR